MLNRRNVLLLAAGAIVFLSSVVCGFGAQTNGAPAAGLPTVDLNVPSGGGGQPAATAAAITEVPAFISLPTATPEQPGAAEVPTVAPAIPESRRLTLEYPPRIRTGDSDIVRLTLEVDTLGNVTPTAETQGNVIAGKTVHIPNLYDMDDVIAEARLDLAGLEIQPADVISEPLLPGQSATFYWSVRPTSPGTYRGTAWLFLRFIDKATKQETRRPLAAQTVEISTAQLLGLGGSLARGVGGLGSVVGAVLGLPFVDDVLKWIWRRARRGD